MKLPEILSGLVAKKDDSTQYFFSLYLDVDAVAAAVWSITAGLPRIWSFAHAVLADDTWESRIRVTDRLLSAAEDKVGVKKAITKTVFGVPGAYLTPDGNISPDIRPELKKLSRVMELEPVGFVPISQAIAFSLKKDEGVPPSVIIVGCSGSDARVTMYRVGKVTHEETIPFTGDPAASLEAFLRKTQDGEVLPSRILLSGGNQIALEEIKGKLLKHPWPTRANFLHFPKIEIFSVEPLVTAVSLAGASELAHDIGESTEEEPAASTVVAQAPVVPSAGHAGEGIPTEEEAAQSHPGEDEEEADTGDADDDPGTEESEKAGDGESGDDEDESDDEVLPGTGDTGVVAEGGDSAVMDPDDEFEDGIVEEPETAADESVANVQVVTPESLGFKHGDVISRPEFTPARGSTGQSREEEPPAARRTMRMPAFSFAPVLSVFRNMSGKLPAGGAFVYGAVALVVLAAVGMILYRTLPRVTVSVQLVTQTVEEQATVTVDDAATVADPATGTVPGRVREISVSGEKSAAATGKKSVGDPAKGTVTIYNKMTSEKTLKKGTVITSGTLKFTLDSDVLVKAATVTGLLGSETKTFGQTSAAVTASDIGPNSNLAANTTFTVQGFSSGEMAANNPSAFSGGTARQVTVVSRADLDGIVKALTAELVEKAKAQFAQGTAGETIVDATVKTEVTQKEFSAEPDEEVADVTGKLTVTVSGTGYLDGDVRDVLLPKAETKVPSGYKINRDQVTVTAGKATVKKDGSITLAATVAAVSSPVIDTDAIRNKLAGKSMEEAQAILRETQGIASSSFSFSWSPTEKRMPGKAENITISIAVR